MRNRGVMRRSLGRKCSKYEEYKNNTLEERKASYNESISGLKDTFDAILKFSSLSLAFPALMLWGYLRSIGWGEIFLDSISSVSGLVALLVCSAALMVVICIEFFIPSMMVIFALDLKDSRLGNPKRKATIFVALYLFPALAWALVFPISLEIFGYSEIAWALVIALAFAMGAASFVSYFTLEDFIQRELALAKLKNDCFLWSHRRLILTVIAKAAHPAVVTMFQLAPFFVCTLIAGNIDWANEHDKIALYFLCALTILAWVPGLAYVYKRIIGYSSRSAFVFSSRALIILAGILFFVIFNISPIFTLGISILLLNKSTCIHRGPWRSTGSFLEDLYVNALISCFL